MMSKINSPSTSRSGGSSDSAADRDKNAKDMFKSYAAVLFYQRDLENGGQNIEGFKQMYPECFSCPKSMKPAMTKMQLLRIKAVKENDIATLKRLANRSKWYKFVHPPSGNTLLHFALLCQRWYGYGKEVFDYLLSFAGFPVNHKNWWAKTALDLCFCGNIYPEHFMYELVRKGASVNYIPLHSNKTLLHCSIDYGYMKLFKLAIDKGYDVDARESDGITPLWACLESKRLKYPDMLEMVTTLLCHGADPTLGHAKQEYNAFEFAIKWFSYDLIKILFNYMIDEFASVDVHFEILLLLARKDRAMFRATLKRVNTMVLSRFLGPEDVHDLFVMNTADLDALIKRCPDEIRKIFSIRLSPHRRTFSDYRFFGNLKLLLESDVRDATLDCIERDSQFFIVKTPTYKNESDELSQVCFLASYGFLLEEHHLSFLSERNGPGECTRILSHLLSSRRKIIDDAFPRLIYDVHSTLDDILRMAYEGKLTDVKALLPYFSNTKLRRCCRGLKAVATIRKNQPNVPLLVELCRNSFRDFFIKKFEITDSMQFRRLVQQLPISHVYKRIIMFEKKLYFG